ANSSIAFVDGELVHRCASRRPTSHAPMSRSADNAAAGSENGQDPPSGIAATPEVKSFEPLNYSSVAAHLTSNQKVFAPNLLEAPRLADRRGICPALQPINGLARPLPRVQHRARPLIRGRIVVKSVDRNQGSQKHPDTHEKSPSRAR